MGKYKEISVKKVVSELNVSYFLPDIQRDYVWLKNKSEHKIENLFDSILRGYPIGTFLLWHLRKSNLVTDGNDKSDSRKFNFQLYQFVESYKNEDTTNEMADFKKINVDDLHIVLDGQQRLTSLYIGLKGSRWVKKPRADADNPNSYIEKFLYLNLRYAPDPDNPDDNYQFAFFSPDELKNDADNYWFKVSDVLEIESPVEYSDEHKLGIPEAKIIEKLQKALCGNDIISYYEEDGDDTDIDKMLQIFIRINSGGTVLSYSDLLMSILTADFKMNIRSSMQDVVNCFKNKGFEIFGRDQVLKTCLLLTCSSHSFKLANFNKSNIRKIENNWDSITDKLFDAAKIVEELGYAKALASAFIISTICLYLYSKNKSYRQILKDEKAEMLKFVQNAQIKGFFSGSTDTKLSTVASVMKEATSFKDFNQKMKDSHNLEISREDIDSVIDTVQYSNNAALPILQLLYSDLNYQMTNFHIDHIYPYSKFNAKNKLLPEAYRKKQNHLFNLQLLPGAINQSKNDKDPNDWINEEYPTENAKREYKRKNYIDEDFSLEWDKIQEFEVMRKKKLKEKLLSVFNLNA